MVKYLLENVGVSAREAGRNQSYGNAVYYYSPGYYADAETYLLRIAIKNKDLDTFVELWSHYMSWDLIHLKEIITYVEQEHWL